MCIYVPICTYVYARDLSVEKAVTTPIQLWFMLSYVGSLDGLMYGHQITWFPLWACLLIISLICKSQGAEHSYSFGESVIGACQDLIHSDIGERRNWWVSRTGGHALAPDCSTGQWEVAKVQYMEKLVIVTKKWHLRSQDQLQYLLRCMNPLSPIPKGNMGSLIIHKL